MHRYVGLEAHVQRLHGHGCDHDCGGDGDGDDVAGGGDRRGCVLPEIPCFWISIG